MDQQLVNQILTGDSDEIADLKLNIAILEGFIELARQLETLSETSKRFYEESRSLYQVTCTGRSIGDLEALLAKFFGPPVKPAGKSLPRKLRKNASVKYLGGIEKDQSLFLLPLNTGEFYGALWPWRRNKAKIEIHLGYCSDWMTDEDYRQIETLVKRSLSQSALQHMDARVGGQIRGIGLPSFLQMAELEQSSFTLRITSAGRVGQLHVAEGKLIAAETSSWTGREAAYRIISWDDAAIDIEPADPSRSDEIHQPLMHLLMESLKLKDEITSGADAPPAPPRTQRPKAGAPKPSKRLVRLERPPEPLPPRRGFKPSTYLIAFLALLVILGSGTVAVLHVMQQRATADRYQQLISRLERTDALEQQLALLNTYLAENPATPHADDIQTRINIIRSRMEARDFEATQMQVSALPMGEGYEENARALYDAFLAQYPDSRFTSRIEAAIEEIKDLLDQHAYEELRRAARLDYNQRLAVYRRYLEQFPEGRYHADVNFLLSRMGEQYLDYLQTEDAQCDRQRRWEPCIQRYQLFVESHEGMPLAEQARRRMQALQDKADLARLRREAEDGEEDLPAAVAAYETYLADHPDSTQKEALTADLAALRSRLEARRQWDALRQYATNPRNDVLERIRRLEDFLQKNSAARETIEARRLLSELSAQRQQALRQRQTELQRREAAARRQEEQARQAEQQQRMARMEARITQQLAGSTRYRPNGDGTFTDGATGLIWTLLDSRQALGRCLDYESARHYVRDLNTGGHRDWRLPSANELAALHKQTPYFPAGDAEWYWTSQAYVRGFHAVADVVTARGESVFVRENRSQDDCGAVRAVRR